MRIATLASGCLWYGTEFNWTAAAPWINKSYWQHSPDSQHEQRGCKGKDIWHYRPKKKRHCCKNEWKQSSSFYFFFFSSFLSWELTGRDQTSVIFQEQPTEKYFLDFEIFWLRAWNLYLLSWEILEQTSLIYSKYWQNIGCIMKNYATSLSNK